MKCLNIALLLLAGGFYLTNRLVLQLTASGWLRWFLECYANDLFAGLAMVAWADLLLDLGHLPPSAPGNRRFLSCLSVGWYGRYWLPYGKWGQSLTPGILWSISWAGFCGCFWPT